MTEYQKKFAMSEVLVIKHMPPVQFKTKKLKTQANNDCEQYCAHIIGYGFEFFGKIHNSLAFCGKSAFYFFNYALLYTLF